MKTNHRRIAAVLLWILAFVNGFSTLYTAASFEQDFAQDYFSGIALREGFSPYGAEISKLAFEQFGNKDFFNYHPPTSALWMIPFSYLPYQTAFILFMLLSVVGYCVAFRLCLRQLGVATDLLLPLIFLWYPLIFGISMGQTAVLISGLVLGSIWAVKAERPVLAGVLSGIACSFKPYPLLMLLYFLRYSKKALVVQLLSVALPLLLCVLFFGTQIFQDYSLQLSAKNLHRFTSYPIHAGLHGLVYPLLTANDWFNNLADSAGLALSVVGVVSAALIVFILDLVFRKQDPDRALAVILAAMLFLSPLIWQHGYTLLPFSLALLWQRRARYPMLAALILLSIPCLMLAQTVLDISRPEKLGYALYVVMKLPVWGLVYSLFILVFSRNVRTNVC